MPQDSSHEWLLADGAGGFFSGTASGRLARKWHGWWTARKPPRDRVRVMAGWEDYALAEGAGEGRRRENLTWVWRDGGWRRPPRTTAAFLPREVSMDTECSFAFVERTIRFRDPGSPVCEIALMAGDPTESAKWIYGLRPLFVAMQGWEKRDDSTLAFRLQDDLELLVTCTRPLHVSGPGEPRNGVILETEKACEKVWTEDLVAGPMIQIDLQEHGEAVLTLEPRIKGRLIAVPAPESAARSAEETLRRVRLLESVPYANSAGQLIASTTAGRRTILAGYPWFTDWGRDTMIALPGLCLLTGRIEEAADIIAHFLEHLDSGLIPNLFPEAGEEPMYNTIDGTLWLVEAAFRLDAATGGTFVREDAWEKVKEIVAWHVRGTRNNIRVDEADGLLAGGSAGSQLTWMDVKVDGFVPTPRHGKPVEIQGLWYNALRLAEERARELGETAFADECAARSEKCAASFARRFFDHHPHAADVVDRDGPGTADFTLRPNMVIPFALRHNIIPPERRPVVLRAAAARLVTPRGLRTLDPAHADYKPIYIGPVAERDRAYHQGTVWMWLAMPYLKGVYAERATVPELLAQVPALLDGLVQHVEHEVVPGHANEIFDAEPPHAPRGCFAQSWSLAAVIECLCLPWNDVPELRGEGLAEILGRGDAALR